MLSETLELKMRQGCDKKLISKCFVCGKKNQYGIRKSMR